MRARKIGDYALCAAFLGAIFAMLVLNFGTITGFVPGTQSDFEAAYSENFWRHDALVDLAGWTARATGRRVLNERTLMYNDVLASVYQTADASATDYTVDVLTQTRAFLSERGIPFLYVHAPVKYDDNEALMPIAVESNEQAIAEKTFERLDAAGVDYLSLKREMERAGMDFYAAYFRTDHHWKPETALWAAELTMERLSGRYGLPYDAALAGDGAWTATVRPDCFLGSDGKRVGLYFAGMDDFTVLAPSGETRFRMEIPERGIEREGDFAAALLELSHIGEPHHTNAYDAYLDGGGGLTRIENLDNPAGARLLVIGDSYSQPYCAFLARFCAVCVRLDMRYFKDCTLFEYLEQNAFDAVISLFNGVWVNHGAMPSASGE